MPTVNLFKAVLVCFMDQCRCFVVIYMYLQQTMQLYNSYINECSPPLFTAMMKFTVSFSCGKLSPFCEARDAFILYIFDDETGQCLPLIDPYIVRLRTPENVNSTDSVPDYWT